MRHTAGVRHEGIQHFHNVDCVSGSMFLKATGVLTTWPTASAFGFSEGDPCITVFSEVKDAV